MNTMIFEIPVSKISLTKKDNKLRIFEHSDMSKDSVYDKVKNKIDNRLYYLIQKLKFLNY